MEKILNNSYKKIKVRIPNGFVPYTIKGWEIKDGRSYLEIELIQGSLQELFKEIIKKHKIK